MPEISFVQIEPSYLMINLQDRKQSSDHVDENDSRPIKVKKMVFAATPHVARVPREIEGDGVYCVRACVRRHVLPGDSVRSPPHCCGRLYITLSMVPTPPPV